MCLYKYLKKLLIDKRVEILTTTYH